MQGDFRVGEHVVRARLNTIEYQNTSQRVEPKVMQVLLVLVEHAGDVVSRQLIHETVWPDIFVGDDVLVRAISELRRVFLDDPHTHHTIQTIPKVGYRLIAPVSAVAVESPSVDAEEVLSDKSSVSHESLNSTSAEQSAVRSHETVQPEFPGRVSSRRFPVARIAALVVILVVASVWYLFKWRGARAIPVVLPTGGVSSNVEAYTAGSCALISGAVYEVANRQTRANLEVPFASATNGTLLDQWKSNGGDNQRWTLEADGPYWTFTNIATGKLLDVPGGNRTAGVQVDQWQANHAANQKWIVLPVDGGSCKIISQASGLLLDVSRGEGANGASIIQFTDNDGDNQHWVFHLIKKPDMAATSR